MIRTVLLVVISIAAINTAAADPRGLFGHPPPPPCGLPSFTEDLPEDAQKKVKEIWKDWKEGEKCYHQQGLTRELMDSLPKDVRKKVHKDSSLPAFLKKAPKDVQEQFHKILEDKDIPLEEKDKKMHALAQKVLTGDLLKQFNKFYEEMDTKRKSLAEKADKLSPEAKAAYEKLTKLEKERHQILSSLSETSLDELHAYYKERHEKFPKPL